jgi:hypothetical protein
MARATSTNHASTAHREAIVVLCTWTVALVYTIGYAAAFGYGREGEPVRLVMGFPSWVFWGILAPWLLCIVISGWFAFCWMTDEVLEDDESDSGEGTARE